MKFVVHDWNPFSGSVVFAVPAPVGKLFSFCHETDDPAIRYTGAEGVVVPDFVVVALAVECRA